jgi:hypothetical protein
MGSLVIMSRLKTRNLKGMFPCLHVRSPRIVTAGLISRKSIMA